MSLPSLPPVISRGVKLSRALISSLLAISKVLCEEEKVNFSQHLARYQCSFIGD